VTKYPAQHIVVTQGLCGRQVAANTIIPAQTTGSSCNKPGLVDFYGYQGYVGSFALLRVAEHATM
jgi:cephalosporin-C deacetylase-like acetyl esterase